MNQSDIEFFDRIAPTWDADEVRSTPERVKSILGKIGITAGVTVLDLGTVTGVLVPYLSDLVGETGKITGIDFSDGMLTRARQKFSHLGNVEFLKLDFEEEPIPGQYDIVMMYCVFPHLHTPASTFEWLFRMNIRPGGRIIIAFPSDEHFINNIHSDRKSDSDRLQSPQALASDFTALGYQSRVIASTPDEYIVEVAR